MNARIILLLITAISVGSPVQAAPIEMVFPDAKYTPGSPLLFTVILPTGIEDLGSYEIQISLAGTSVAGVDFGFDLNNVEASPTNYVFDSDDMFFPAVLPESTTTEVLLLTDLVLAGGVDVSEEVNDRVAEIVVFTSPSYSGPLVFTIDAPSLILDQPDGNEVEAIAAIRQDIASAAAITIVVPEPTTAGVWMIGTCFAIGCGLARHRRLTG